MATMEKKKTIKKGQKKEETYAGSNCIIFAKKCMYEKKAKRKAPIATRTRDLLDIRCINPNEESYH